jgi:ADP-ribose pyrophosphatase
MPRLGFEDLNTLVDLPADARISVPRMIGRGYRSYERYEVSLPGAVAWSGIDRDVLRSGEVVGILPIDIRRQEVVLIRQFRLASHIALAKGAMIEIPAGRVGQDETTLQAAYRECREEIGADPLQLMPLFAVMPAPALSDECMMLYAASIDADRAAGRGGCEAEQEATEPVVVSIDNAIDRLFRGGFHNSALIIALQWLALNRDKLPAIFDRTGAHTNAG